MAAASSASFVGGVRWLWSAESQAQHLVASAAEEMVGIDATQDQQVDVQGCARQVRLHARLIERDQDPRVAGGTAELTGHGRIRWISQRQRRWNLPFSGSRRVHRVDL